MSLGVRGAPECHELGCFSSPGYVAPMGAHVRKRLSFLLCVLVLVGLTGANRSFAQAPPWASGNNAPLAAEAASLEVLVHDAPIRFEPDPTSARRGSAQRGARLPIFGFEAPRSNCRGRWFLVGPEAWLCEEHARISGWSQTAEPLVTPGVDGLPYRYHFVGPDGSFGYATLSLAEEAIPDSQLEPGFAVALERVETKAGGDSYGLTTHGLWLPLRDLRPARPPTFSGRTLAEGQRGLAWVHREHATVYKKPWYGTGETMPRLSPIEVLEEVAAGGQSWLMIGAQRWLRAADVRQVNWRDPPDEVRPNERWLDVDTGRQTLVAYEGSRPVFATLVSTGKGLPNSPQATPLGHHRIWVKLVSTDMTNLEDAETNRYYAIEEVPWVMFFKQGYGLHGAFWHDSFGNRRSHGCINLSPRDAHFIFQWAGPELPLGWRASHPTTYDQGTLVVVR